MAEKYVVCSFAPLWLSLGFVLLAQDLGPLSLLFLSPLLGAIMFYKVCQGFIKVHHSSRNCLRQMGVSCMKLKVELGKHFVKISNHLQNKNPYRLRSLFIQWMMNPLGPVASKPAKRPMKATHNITHLRLEPDRMSLFLSKFQLGWIQ
jgi:hypothetical protein